MRCMLSMACVCRVAYWLLFVLYVLRAITVMRLVMHKLIMLSLHIAVGIQVTNMKWAARKCHLVGKHDMRVFWLSTHCVQGGRAFVGCMNPAGPSALVLRDEKIKQTNPDLCEMSSWFPCLLECPCYPHLVNILTRLLVETLNKKMKHFIANVSASWSVYS